jgi:hypothetical protein
MIVQIVVMVLMVTVNTRFVGGWRIRDDDGGHGLAHVNGAMGTGAMVAGHPGQWPRRCPYTFDCGRHNPVGWTMAGGRLRSHK